MCRRIARDAFLLATLLLSAHGSANATMSSDFSSRGSGARGSSNAGSNSQAIQNFINGVGELIGRAAAPEPDDNQMMQRIEQEHIEQEQKQRQFDLDLGIRKKARRLSDCKAIVTPRLKENCIAYFELLKRDEMQREAEEKQRKKDMEAAPQKGTDSVLMGLTPVSAPVRGKSK
ncbi:hypothetical protein [Methyloraptor flagellatus]|jgi:hypothetical protein|uniref:Uncharacterized protein n=1 Tax=Methyloraptor flagellatus TaxID=3162530 RepID=A0AAU7XEN0_9HYPH